MESNPSLGSEERFTVDYIQREAEILLSKLGKFKRRGFTFSLGIQNPRDQRILKSWGLF